MTRVFKKSTAVVLSLMFVLSLILTMASFKTEAAASGFYVSGTKICDANGKAFQMRGVNIAHAWYPSYTQTSIKAAASLGANTVRVVLSDGGQYSKTSYSEVSNIISWCKSNKLVCILEVHDATGSDSTSDLNRAVNYWISLKDLLNNNRKYVMVNIANEWYGTWDGSGWANGNKSAIQSLRNAGIKNTLIVDCAGWGQYPASVHNYGKSVFSADSEKNTVFSIHMYEYAGGDSSTVKNNIDGVLNNGLPVIIGEFGNKHTNGDVDEYTIMSYCKSKGVGYIGWSWKGNGSDWAYLDIANNWDGSSLSDWGNTLFYSTNGIKNTSSICSVYTGSSSSGSSSSGSSSSGSSSSGSSSSGSSSSGSSSSSSSANYVSLFYGSASASGWDQAVSVATTRAGGSFDASNIKSGGHFYVEYKGTQNQVELVLQSWSGGSSWGKVSISESGTANGNYYAKFSYNNCVSTFGSSDFAGKLDKIHVGATGSDIEVVSVCYDFGSSSSDSSSSNSSSDSGSSSSGSSSSGSSSSDSSSSGSSSSSSSSSGSSSSSSSANYVSLFYGSASASGWDQAVSVATTRAGGSFDASNIKSGGHFYVEYKGTQNQVELVLQSWSGGSSWGKVSISESGTANGNYYAKFSYNNCVSTFGSSDFAGKLDKIHVGATGSDIEVVSVCYDFGSSSSDSSSSNSSSSNNSSSNNVYTNSDGGIVGLDGVYYIKNVHSNLYLDVDWGNSANGTNIQQHSYNGSDAQKFKLVGDGNGYYSILTGATNYESAVDVEAKKSADGANIIQWKYNGGNNQKFQLVKIGDAYAIKTKISNCYSCIEVYGASTSNCANVDQWTYYGNSHQLWYLEAC